MSDDLINQLIADSGATANRDVLRDILRSAVGLASEDADRLNLTITASALKEMRAAFSMIAPFEGTQKATISGSTRTAADDPLYAQAPDPARHPAPQPWTARTNVCQ